MAYYDLLENDIDYGDGEVIECFVEAGVPRVDAHFKYYQGLAASKYPVATDKDNMLNRIFSKKEIGVMVEGIKELEGL